MTLDKRQGNAFDTASLLIALLRSSGVPARYVYGTVDIPADKLQNWVGGTTNPDAAQNIMGQGGIPNVGLTKNGKTIAIRMEHVWIEAWIDFYPSRGAKNIQGDTWVPMDATFKQYAYTEEIDLQQEVPFDAEDFLAQAEQGATINQEEGYVQGLNQANIHAQLASYQTQLHAYIQNQNPDATVGEVLGAKAITPYADPTLADSLPYSVIVKGSSYSALPTSLRHQFQYSLYAGSTDLALDNPILTFQDSTPDLAGKKITLSFVPATAQDRDVIESYLPQPHEDGSQIQPEEFPQSLPAYAIHVKAELKVEGYPVATSTSDDILGTEFIGQGGFTQMNLQGYDLTQDAQIAGQSSALGITLQGISSMQRGMLKNRMEGTKAKLVSRDVDGLSGDYFSGDLLAATILGYHAALESFGRLSQRRAGIIDIPGLSFGFVHAQAVPKKQYGTISQVIFSGLLMDIGHIRRISYAKNNSSADWIRYNNIRGQHSSAMEHAIPESIYSEVDGMPAPSGYSAVKALAVAALQGQKIYTLTPENQEQLANIQQSTAVKNQIESALAAGMVVTIHERPISDAGFNGAGYTIVDPQTGAGAYLIEGGANGAFVIMLFIAALIAVIGLLPGLAFFLGFGGGSFIMLAVMLFMDGIPLSLTAAFDFVGGFGCLVEIASIIGSAGLAGLLTTSGILALIGLLGFGYMIYNLLAVRPNVVPREFDFA